MRDLHPAVHDQSRVRKIYGMFGRELHFKDVKCKIFTKLRKRISKYKILVMKTRKNVQCLWKHLN